MTHTRPRLEEAACRGHAEIYLAETHPPEDLKFMRKTCGACPEVAACLNYSIRREAFGFWAGTTAPERSRLRKKHEIDLELIHVGPYLA